MLPDAAASALADGAAALGLPLDERQTALLVGYLQRLEKWNRVYNLTAIRDAGQMVTHHLLDSMTVIDPLRRQVPALSSLLDVGSGAGLPGAVVAILMPEVDVACVDAVSKKAAFVQQAAAELGIRNLRSVHSRIEDLRQPRPDVIASRAFASLDRFVAATRHLQGERTCWLAMKGTLPSQEIAALPTDVEVFHVEQVAVPGLKAERHLVWMRIRASQQG